MQAAAEAEALRQAKARDQGRSLRHVRLEAWDRHYYTGLAKARRQRLPVTQLTLLSGGDASQ